MADSPAPGLPWHEALAYAVVGRRIAGLGRQAEPDPVRLVTDLSAAYGGIEQLRVAVSTVRSSADGRWPIPLPPDLSAELGAAQFWAALTVLRGVLVPAPNAVSGGGRPLNADERRLLLDVPPHHGS